MAKPTTLYGAVQNVGFQVERIASALGQTGAGSGDLVAAAAGPYEEAFLRYSVGTGTFHLKDKTGYIVVNGRMYTPGGQEDGEYEAVFQAWFSDPRQVLEYPAAAKPPFDKVSKVPEITDVNQTKARWTFGDGSSLSGPGPAVSYIAPLADGSFQFWVSAATFITGGTGRFDKAVGQECSLGSTWFPSQPQLEPGTVFEAKVLHTFRVILGRDRGAPPK